MTDRRAELHALVLRWRESRSPGVRQCAADLAAVIRMPPVERTLPGTGARLADAADARAALEALRTAKSKAPPDVKKNRIRRVWDT